MRIVADSNILSIKSYLADIADLQLVPGREITRENLRNADVLLVRSTTRVDAELLRGTPVKFVGSATSGTDHIDLEYLRSAKIFFADARGSNANAVVDYCFAALAFAVLHRNLQLDLCTVGLVGAGHVGGLVAQKLAALGIAVQVCDPPLLEMLRAASPASPEGVAATGAETIMQGRPVPPRSIFRNLDEVLQCDVISLHVPLILDGKYKTYKLLGERELRQLKPNATLINTCRGSVVDEPALIDKLRTRADLTCIVDVWDNEPNVDLELIARADIATPHIAGYSKDAKQAATMMLLDAMSRYFELPVFEPGQRLVPVQIRNEPGRNLHNAQWRYLLEMLPLQKLSGELKQSALQGNVDRQFDAMRKHLMDRREFRNFEMAGAELSAEQKLFLRAQGLQLG